MHANALYLRNNVLKILFIFFFYWEEPSLSGRKRDCDYEYK